MRKYIIFYHYKRKRRYFYEHDLFVPQNSF